jgi:hypothetical protein
MSHHDVGNNRRPVESETIDRVITALREPVPVRPAWRAALLAGIGDESNNSSASTVARWSFRPMTAVAAAIACMMVGATVAAFVLGRPPRDQSASDVLTNLTATMPMPGEHGTASVVRFVFVAPHATRVSLVGDFNRWNPAAMPMRRSADGRAWLLDVPLTAGRHVYSFSVDGDLTADPAAPQSGDDDFGVPSSVVLVGGKA